MLKIRGLKNPAKYSFGNTDIKGILKVKKA